jgi:hypothetical protein
MKNSLNWWKSHFSGRIFGENWPIEKRLLPTIVICETWLWCSCARKNMRASPPPVLSMWPWKPKPNENAQGGLLFFLLRLGRRGLFPMCSHYVPPPPPLMINKSVISIIIRSVLSTPYLYKMEPFSTIRIRILTHPFAWVTPSSYLGRNQLLFFFFFFPKKSKKRLKLSKNLLFHVKKKKKDFNLLRTSQGAKIHHQK